MPLTRRQFLHMSGLAAAYAALPGWLAACARADAVPAAATLAQPDTWAAPASAMLDAALLHLLNRITYGPRPGELQRVAALGYDQFLEQQLHPETIDDAALERRLAAFPSLAMSNAQRLRAYPPKKQAGDPPAAGPPQQMIAELEAAALLRAIFSERQLLEIMVDFWSNHLNIYIGKNQVKWFKTSDDRDVIRPHALGTFRDLLLASAKSPAMLIYLDNARNVAPGARRGGKGMAGINENYAREVMELHTVGVDGGYTQDDVTAVARTLTGWTIGRPGSPEAGAFIFVERLHDRGEKRIGFLELSFPAGGGMAEGEELLVRLASHPKTADRLAHKLAAAFVADDPSPALVARAAQTYLQSSTDIRATLAVILRSDEFRAAAGQKIKLPLRMLVSSLRALGAEVSDHTPLLQTLRLLGQPFFGWAAPNGYPQTGAAWVNSGAMLVRWNTAFALAAGRLRGVAADLNRLVPEGATAGALVDAVAGGLLHAPLPVDARAPLVEYASDGRGEAARLEAAARAHKLAGVAGLILASPVFQVH
jgi:uncharacterized protein (DUF1800 family)